jgi:uridylate kinase
MSSIRSVLVKISGEAMMNDRSSGFSIDQVSKICLDVKAVLDSGIRVVLVVGGGNIIRGRDWCDSGIVRLETADAMGMLSTAINGIMLRDVLSHHGISAEIVSNLNLPFDVSHANSFNISKIIGQNKVIIFVGGIGLPYCSTDTVSVIAAALSGCDILLKATHVDGIYSDDPKIAPGATHISEITYQEAINNQLNFMDKTALIIAMQRKIPIYVFSIGEKNCLLRAVNRDIRLSIVKTHD